MSSVTFSPSVGGDGSTVTDDSNATTGLDGGGHRTRFVPALAQVVAVAANTVTKAGEASSSASAAAAQVPLAAAHAATAATQATASASSAAAANTSASAASASATSAATSATSAGTAATAATTVMVNALVAANTVVARPTLRPSLSVDWTLKPTAAALTAAGWTITRASAMTYFGPTPVKVAENLFTQSRNFGDASWVKTGMVAPAAITDESGLVGSTVIASATTGDHELGQLATATNLGSQTYRVRFLCKAAAYTKAIIADRTTGRAAAAFDLAAGTTIASTFGAGYTSHSIDAHSLGGGLYWCSLVMTSAAAGTNWEPTIIGYPDSGATLSATGASYTGDGTSGIEVYAAQLQQGFDGDFIETTTTPITLYAPPLLTAATDQLAYQHNASGECTGLLSYPAATNVCLHSQDLSQAVWGRGRVTATASKRYWAGSAVAAAGAPAGAPFYRIAKTDAGGSASTSQACFTPAAGSTWSATVALMGDYWSNTTSADVGLMGTENGVWGATADTSAAILSGQGTLSKGNTGALHRVTGLSLTVPTVVRVTRTYPLAESAPCGVAIYPGTASSTTVGAATLVTRVQVESGPRSTPYIPTTGGQAIRAAQSVALTGSAFAAVSNPEQGTLLIRASVEDAVFETTRYIVGLHTGSALSQSDNRIYMTSYLSTANIQMGAESFGVSQANNTNTGSLTQTPKTLAYAYAPNRFTPAINGVAAATDTAGIVPVFDRLQIGWSSAADLPCLIQRTELYPRAMTSPELAAITTPGVLV